MDSFYARLSLSNNQSIDPEIESSELHQHRNLTIELNTRIASSGKSLYTEKRSLSRCFYLMNNNLSKDRSKTRRRMKLHSRMARDAFVPFIAASFRLSIRFDSTRPVDSVSDQCFLVTLAFECTVRCEIVSIPRYLRTRVSNVN